MIDVLDKGFVDLVDSMPTAVSNLSWGPGDRRVVTSARVSYAKRDTTEEQDKRLLRYLLANKHYSPFEQVKFTFHAKAPIFVARQWFRHRTFQINEISARYATVADEFYTPELGRLQGQAKDNKQCSGEELPFPLQQSSQSLMQDAITFAYDAYKDLLEKGLSRELARIVLPVAQYTEFYASIDLRNLLSFISLRDHSHAQWEIQQYAKALRTLARNVAPYTIAVIENETTKL